MAKYHQIGMSNLFLWTKYPIRWWLFSHIQSTNPGFFYRFLAFASPRIYALTFLPRNPNGVIEHRRGRKTLLRSRNNSYIFLLNFRRLWTNLVYNIAWIQTAHEKYDINFVQLMPMLYIYCILALFEFASVAGIALSNQSHLIFPPKLLTYLSSLAIALSLSICL